MVFVILFGVTLPIRVLWFACFTSLWAWVSAIISSPSLLFRRRRGFVFALREILLAQNGLYARDVAAQPANLLQAFRLSHVHLELQLEELVGQVSLLVLEFHVGQVANLFCFHKIGSQLSVVSSSKKLLRSCSAFHFGMPT